MNENEVSRWKLKDHVTIIVHTFSFDGLYSCFILANSALSLGMQVSIFFTSTAVMALTKAGFGIAPLSRSTVPLPGKFILRKLKGVKPTPSMEDLVHKFKELGGKIIACDTTIEFFGMKKKYIREELIDDYWAVGRYVLNAKNSKLNFII